MSNEFCSNNKFLDFNRSLYSDRTSECHTYMAGRNLNELAVMINRLFDKYSRLLIVRVDLSYLAECAPYITLEAAQLHRKKLLGDRRAYPEIFDEMLGYAWGLERGGKAGGFHYHFLALYNGANRRDDIGIGMAIGDIWRAITNGCGHCYISNFDKAKMAQQGILGIGMIHRDNVDLRINLLERVAGYLTKKSSEFATASGLTQSGGFRTFGKSQMPDEIDPNAKRRGRPGR